MPGLKMPIGEKTFDKPGKIDMLARGSLLLDYCTFRTLVCSGSPQAGYDSTVTFNGAVINKSHRTFSADSKLMMIHALSMHPDGSTSALNITFKRLTGTSGFPGKWLNIKETAQVPEIQTWNVHGNLLHLVDPVRNMTFEARLDGTPTHILGPEISLDSGIRITSDGSDTLRWTILLGDKPLIQGTWTLSADGKTIKEVSWRANTPSETATVVWDKQ